MAFLSDSSDNFNSAMEELIDKLDDVYTGVLAGVKRLLSSDSKYKHQALELKLARLRYESTYWNHLKQLLIYVQKYSNADKVVPDLGSLLTTIKAAFSEIIKKIEIVCDDKFVSRKSLLLETIDVFRDWERKIDLCKQETGQALDLLSHCSLEWKLPLLSHSFCSEFLVSVSEILKEISAEREGGDQKVDDDQRAKIKAFRNDLLLPLISFLKDALRQLNSDVPSDQMISSFNTHIASLAVRIANESFHYWINRKGDPALAKSKIIQLLDLQCEIRPTTPEILELNLNFLKALIRINRSLADGLAISFLQSLLNVGEPNHLSGELKQLVTFVINEPDESSPDGQSISEEIKAVLILAASFSRRMQLGSLSAPKLHTRISLLKAEVFLKQQLKSCTISSESRAEDLDEIVQGLRISSKDQPEEAMEHGKPEPSSVLIEEVAKEVVSLEQSFCDKKITEEKVRISLFMLLLKILLFKAESSYMELLNSDPSLMSLEKDQIETLLEGLRLCSAFVTNQPEKMKENVELIFTQVEANARRITSFCYSFLDNKKPEEKVEKMNPSFSDLLQGMAMIKSELRGSCPQYPRHNFPKTDGLGFVDYLLVNLRELLKHDPDSIALVKHHIENILSNLEFLRSFLNKLDNEHLDQMDLVTDVTNAAYEAEFIIDSIEVGIGSHWQHVLWLDEVLEEIRLIKMQTTKIYEEKTSDARDHIVSQNSSHMKSPVSIPEAGTGEQVVSLSDEEETIIYQLTRGSPQRDIVSIVGMPGIGKTTLAKKLYNDPRVTLHFHARGWCSISQEHAKRELLVDILSNSGELTDDVYQMADEDMDLKLRQHLMRKRYLIVMDDMWDTHVWNALEKSFPNEKTGSRILITSRLRDVVLEIKPEGNPHSLRLLSDDESWELLQLKIFHGGCPNDLLKAGMEIAKNCRGLPLSVVAIAGLLERTEQQQASWKSIAESLSARLIDDPHTRCMDILQLSYMHLPDYLKACLLYFGAFLEDEDIPVSKLIRLWIAEGFIRQTVVCSLENLAENYLTDLIGRSLVAVAKKGPKGRVKSCRLHDMIRDFCLSKAKEENFFQVITGYDELFTSFDDLDCGADFIDHYPSKPVTFERHRICICLNRKHFVMSNPSGPCTRSLLFFATVDPYPRRPYDISFLPRQFKLLRVLDLECINMGISFPPGIELLVQLRYLAVSGDIDFIPPSISNLRKLETFIVKGLKGKVVLPDSIWSMERLRHLHVNTHVDFNFQDDKPGNSLKLVNLVSFSLPSLARGKAAKMILKRMPNLRKFECIYLESWDAYTNYNRFPVLDLLIHLESLKIVYVGRALNPGELNLPWNLKKLTLSSFRLPWTHISAIGRLPNLEVLKLLSRAFEGPRWDMREGEFLGLKYLKLDSLNIVQWNASSDHLPNLQQLHLQNCKDLEEVPLAFADIDTLQMIEVQSCGLTTEESVKRIGNECMEGLKIIINNKIHLGDCHLSEDEVLLYSSTHQ